MRWHLRGPLTTGVSQQWTSDENTRFLAAQGSGWGWLGYSKQLGKVVMTTSPNQDPVHLQVQPQMPRVMCMCMCMCMGMCMGMCIVLTLLGFALSASCYCIWH